MARQGVLLLHIANQQLARASNSIFVLNQLSRAAFDSVGRHLTQ